MNIRHHGNWAHGLEPGTTHDLNCGACQREVKTATERQDAKPDLYIATVNVPGYLPMADEPAVFDSAYEAWSYLAEERERDEDSAEMVNDDYADEPYSETRETLAVLGTEAHWQHSEHSSWLADNGLTEHGEGTVYGDTPGYDGDHDLGLAYSVAMVAPDGDGYAELSEALLTD